MATTPKAGNVRMKKDSLGEKAVPAEAYYGIQAGWAIENYPSAAFVPTRC